MQGEINMEKQTEKQRLEAWRIQSPDVPGFHPVITPENCECRVTYVYRLNLLAGQKHILESGKLELHPVLIEGTAEIEPHAGLENRMDRFDAFYIPAGERVGIKAVTNCVFYIGGAVYENIGTTFFRKYNPDLPLGDIHQIHGAGVGRREVMFTLDPQTPASRLICGLTWGGQGAWTSWPPHQHEKDLEEVYCYFDIPHPKFGFHISYLRSGDPNGIVAHTVQTGTMVQAPAGYHPTVASPAGQNAYFWVLSSFTPARRRYDLAILDPAYREF
jgi:5-deoxy-glucuronate isomerase